MPSEMLWTQSRRRDWNRPGGCRMHYADCGPLRLMVWGSEKGGWYSMVRTQGWEWILHSKKLRRKRLEEAQEEATARLRAWLESAWEALPHQPLEVRIDALPTLRRVVELLESEGRDDA